MDAQRFQHIGGLIVAACGLVLVSIIFFLEKRWHDQAFPATAVVVEVKKSGAGNSFVRLEFKHPDLGLIEFTGPQEGEYKLKMGEGLDILYNPDYPDLPYPYRLNNAYEPWILSIMVGALVGLFILVLGVSFVLSGIGWLLRLTGLIRQGQFASSDAAGKESVVSFHGESDVVSDAVNQPKHVGIVEESVRDAWDFWKFKSKIEYRIIVEILGVIVILATWCQVYNGFIAKIPAYEDLEQIQFSMANAELGKGELRFTMTIDGNRFTIDQHMVINEWEYTQIKQGAYPNLLIRFHSHPIGC